VHVQLQEEAEEMKKRLEIAESGESEALRAVSEAQEKVQECEDEREKENQNERERERERERAREDERIHMLELQDKLVGVVVEQVRGRRHKISSHFFFVSWQEHVTEGCGRRSMLFKACVRIKNKIASHVFAGLCVRACVCVLACVCEWVGE
jgi:beta-glucosidase-like glycosyl hydrolase